MDNMNQPKPVHKTNWMVIILLIVICAIVAVGIWWWTNDTAKIASLEQQVAQSEVKTIGTTVTPSVTATATATIAVTPTPTATSSADTRTLLTPDEFGIYLCPKSTCKDEKFNGDPASTTIIYKSSHRGIKVDLPWNPKWGSQDYRFNPYDEITTSSTPPGDRLKYGVIYINGEGDDGSHKQFLRSSIGFLTAQTAADRISVLKAPSAEFVFEPIEVNINGLSCVKFAAAGMDGTHYYIEVIGEKYNYQFEDASWKEVEGLVNTVELI